MAFPFPRVKTWVALETLVFSDLNAEFDNVLNNNKPANFDDYSANASQMQTETSPGTSGSESLATSLAGELERIRYVLHRIIDGNTGGTYWYTAPARSLAASFPDLAFYLPFDGATGAKSFQDTIRRGAIINGLSYSTADVSTASFDTTNKKFGLSSFITGGTNILAYPGYYGRTDQGTLSLWFRNITSNDYLAYNPLTGHELFIDGSGHLVSRIRNVTANGAAAKAFTTVTGTTSVANITTFNHVLTKWYVNGENGSAADQLALKLNGTAEGSQLTAQTVPVNVENGGVWFFGVKPNTPTWTNYLSMSQLPSADGWTFAGTASTNAVSGGVLNVVTGASLTASYARTGATVTGLDLSQMTIEFKLKINSLSDVGFVVECRDDSMDRSIYMTVSSSGAAIFDSPASTTAPNLASAANGFKVAVDGANWNVYRITSSGTPSPTVTLYINGVQAGSFVSNTVDATANDTLLFGDNTGTGIGTMDFSLEWFAFGPVSTPPIAVNSTTGNLDDIGMFLDFTGDGAIDTSLSTTQVKSAIQRDRINGPTLPNSRFQGAVFSAFFPSDGLTPITVVASGNAPLAADGNITVFYLQLGANEALGGSWAMSDYNRSTFMGVDQVAYFVTSTRKPSATITKRSTYVVGLVSARLGAVDETATVKTIISAASVTMTFIKG